MPETVPEPEVVPELTGHRRYRQMDHLGFYQLMVVEVAQSVWDHAQKKWTVQWRYATPEDLPGETIIGLPDQRS